MIMNDKKNHIDFARAEFDRMAAHLEIQASGGDDDHAAIVDAIQSGKITVGDNGLPTVKLRDAKEIVFKEPTGATLLAMDRAKKDEDMRKTFFALSELTGEPPKVFSGMALSDSKICLGLVALFLG